MLTRESFVVAGSLADAAIRAEKQENRHANLAEAKALLSAAQHFGVKTVNIYKVIMHIMQQEQG